MKKLAIFDLDGTIIHSIPDILEYINVMLGKYGFNKIDENTIRHFIGNGARNLVKRSLNYCGANFSEEKIDECLKFYNGLYTSSNSPKTRLFEGMEEILFELKKRDYYLAIVTNKPQITTDNVVERYLKQFSFSSVVGGADDRKRKPDPTETLKLIDSLGVDKKDTCFIGDGETDVETAINAGIKGIAVLWGYRDKFELAKVGANVFASSPKELLDLLK